MGGAGRDGGDLFFPGLVLNHIQNHNTMPFLDDDISRAEVFRDNTKSWSGDHCMNPPDVPGIFFCNRKVKADKVNIMDIGPTVLDLFGVRVPAYCDGKSLMPEKSK